MLVPSPRRTPTAYFGDDVAVLLARLHPTRGAALVLGAGPGAVATHIARTARRVLAVDPDPIAHACAELNVAMLGTQNVELRCAAIETELGDEKFDRIAVAPTHPMPIADGPAIEETGPAVLARVLAALPARLLPGGIAQLVGILHGNEDGPALPQLSALAAEHGVRAVVTVPSRQQLAPGSALFEAFSNGLAAARSLDPSVVKRAHHRYLTDRRATHMYLASITLAHSATPGVEVTRHWTRPGGGWQR